MRLSPYITFKHEEDIYIAQTAFPNYLACVRRYETDFEMRQTKTVVKCQVDGYRILLLFSGTLQGNFVYIGDQVKDLQKIVDQMAFWYFIHRVDKDRNRYNRWKL